MGSRNVYGNDWSENDWPMVDTDSCEWVTVPGTDVSLQIQQGWPVTILGAFAADYNAHIEKLRDGDSACWTPTNSVATSNHLSGTGMDLNWDGPDGKTFRLGIPIGRAYPGDKAAKLRELLDFYEGMIFCGGFWSIQDWMHFQMGGDTFQNPKTADFIRRKIRSDGFSTFRRGSVPGPSESPAAAILARATGLSLERATEILPAVQAGLLASDCANTNRIAAWLAQIGHESGSFQYTEEIDKNGRYAPYIGRTWIQITWESNYRKFSEWCFDKGLVPTSDYFVVNYRELADLKWAGLGAAWYWTVERPDINTLCDAGDFDTVTYRINGGQNGATDRRSRYQRALQVGGVDLVLLLDTQPQEQTIEELLMADTLYPSVSIYKTPGEGPQYTLAQLIQSIDGLRHRDSVEEAALLGSLEDIDRIFRVAAGAGEYTDAYAVNHAKAFIAELEKKNQPALKEYLAAKGVA